MKEPRRSGTPVPDTRGWAWYATAMSDYRRYFVAGGTYFFTLVTERRARLFESPAVGRLLGDSVR